MKNNGMRSLKALLIILLLLCFRGGNFTLIWNIQKNEITDTKDLWERVGQLERGIFYYKPVGFSPFGISDSELLKLAGQRKEKVVVLNYYDFIHQSVFLIHNKASECYIPLTGCWFEFEKGITRVLYYMFDYGVREDINGTEKKIVEISGSLLSYFKKLRDGIGPVKEDSGRFSIQIVSVWPHSPPYVKFLNIVYFYIPLVLIPVSRLFFSNTIFISFFYFFEMLLLFNFNHFSRSPVELFSLISKQKILPWVYINLGILIFIIFAVLIWLGFLKLRKDGFIGSEKYIVLFFLLLPVTLRF